MFYPSIPPSLICSSVDIIIILSIKFAYVVFVPTVPPYFILIFAPAIPIIRLTEPRYVVGFVTVPVYCAFVVPGLVIIFARPRLLSSIFKDVLAIGKARVVLDIGWVRERFLL